MCDYCLIWETTPCFGALSALRLLWVFAGFPWFSWFPIKIVYDRLRHTRQIMSVKKEIKLSGPKLVTRLTCRRVPSGWHKQVIVTIATSTSKTSYVLFMAFSRHLYGSSRPLHGLFTASSWPSSFHGLFTASSRPRLNGLFTTSSRPLHGLLKTLQR